MATSQAIFGNDSWLDWIVTALEIGETPSDESMLAYLSLICHSMPLKNTDHFSMYTMESKSCAVSDIEYYYFEQSLPFPTTLARVLRQFFEIFSLSYMGQDALNTGAFFANDYLLSTALTNAESELDANSTNSIYSYTPFELRAIVPRASLGAIIAISILVGLQVIAILFLLLYIYRRPVWTKALDSLALASIGAQLLQLDIDQRRDQAMSSNTLGVVAIPEHTLQKLWRMDGLIDPGIVHQNARPPEIDVELLTLPPPYAPRSQQPSSTEARPRERCADGQTSLSSHTDAPPYMQSREDLQQQESAVLLRDLEVP